MVWEVHESKTIHMVFVLVWFWFVILSALLATCDMYYYYFFGSIDLLFIS